MNDVDYNSNVYNRVISLYTSPNQTDLAIVVGIWLPMNRSQERSSMLNKIAYLTDAKLRIFYLDSHIPVAV